MGTPDTYENIQLKIGNPMMNVYKLGDKVSIPDGVYLAPEGAVVIRDGKLLFTTSNIQDKWGGEVDIKNRSPLLGYMQAITIESLEAELAKYRWIPVGERLPKETEEDLRPKHLIYNTDGMSVQEWRHYDFGWCFDENTGPPTHWMEEIILPE